jgi:phosphonopyruvate decarboxylase
MSCSITLKVLKLFAQLLVIPQESSTTYELVVLLSVLRNRQIFLNVGAMGHVSQVALGIALARPDKKVIAIDGDGSLIMHMGSMVISGQSNAANFLHILINNGVHESVGGQPTAGFRIDFTAMALAAGYKNVASVCQLDSLTNFFNDRFLRSGPSFLEVKVRMGVKDKLGRPSNDFLASKEAFERHIRSGN